MRGLEAGPVPPEAAGKPRREIVTRFAPSPTGRLHLGHAHAALFAERAALREGGRFLLRIEDIDTTRCRDSFVEAITRDLAWLGLDWTGPVLRQSTRQDAYRRALERLSGLGLLYPCFCTRRDIAREIARSGVAPHGPPGVDGPLYPGFCRRLTETERKARIAAGEPHALRLDSASAARLTGPLAFMDRGRGRTQVDSGLFGDAVLARKDIGTSYHLSVVVDDAAQGITLVTRGEDLFPATHLHRMLQALLALPVPEWEHHGLIRDSDGGRLAKSRGAPTLESLRESGMSPGEVRALAGFADSA